MTEPLAPIAFKPKDQWGEEEYRVWDAVVKLLAPTVNYRKIMGQRANPTARRRVTG